MPTRDYQIIWRICKNLSKIRTVQSIVVKEEEVEKKSTKILIVAETEKRETNRKEMVKAAVKRMKNEKLGDWFGWKAKWTKNGKQKMIKGLTAVYNKIDKEKNIPE